MPGGEKDSSLTRVQPVFKQLVIQDSTGQSWMDRLLAMGSRSKAADLPTAPGWTGKLMKGRPVFEFSAPPPYDYLHYLLEHPNRLSWRKGKKFSGETQEKRRALLDGNEDMQAKAIECLKRNPRGSKWWIFEGTTQVDCALFAENVTLFIEGKRTEPKLTGHIEWDSKRHQVFRNLDCLRALEERTDRYCVLLIVDEANAGVLDQAKSLDTGFETARESWPHLSDSEAKELFGRYLGYLTWQDLEREFDLFLPNTREDAEKTTCCN